MGKVRPELSQGFSPLNEVITLDNNATPTVAGVQLAISGGTTTITDFDDGEVGQDFKFLSAHALTITHNAAIINLSGSANYVMDAGDTLTLTMFNDQVWEETARKAD